MTRAKGTNVSNSQGPCLLHLAEYPKDDAGSVTAAVLLLPGGFFEEVETWGDRAYRLDMEGAPLALRCCSKRAVMPRRSCGLAHP